MKSLMNSLNNHLTVGKWVESKKDLRFAKEKLVDFDGHVGMLNI